MELTNFNAAGSTGYDIIEVNLVFVFAVPHALSQDSIRFSVEYDGNFESLATISHTQNPLDHMSGNYWRENISGLDEWNWNTLQNIIVTANYESVGGTDDSQLNLDAVGIEVTMQTPWYGGEVAAAMTTFDAHETPLINLDLTAGDSENMGLCVLWIAIKHLRLEKTIEKMKKAEAVENNQANGFDKMD